MKVKSEERKCCPQLLAALISFSVFNLSGKSCSSCRHEWEHGHYPAGALPAEGRLVQLHHYSGWDQTRSQLYSSWHLSQEEDGRAAVPNCSTKLQLTPLEASHLEMTASELALEQFCNAGCIRKNDLFLIWLLPASPWRSSASSHPLICWGKQH